MSGSDIVARVVITVVFDVLMFAWGFHMGRKYPR